MMFTVNALSPALGAEVVGLDLAAGLDGDLAAALTRALLEHVVLVVRDQSLTAGQYVRAMRALGPPARQNHAMELHPEHPEIWIMDSSRAEVAEDGRRLVSGAECWHTDHTNLARPPKITALYSVRLPPSGGDTSFVDARAAYERLPDAVRARIDGLRAVYGADRHLRHREEDRDAFATPVSHPLVRTHPETGRRALYCHPLKAQYIEGMQPEASFSLIDEVLDAALRPEITYRHRWRTGDLVLIDNRACLHRAERDYDPDFGRVMHRLIIEGDEPV
jgi:taurine dioxygenase